MRTQCLKRISTAGLVVLLLSGCSANQSERSHMDRAMYYINQRDYPAALQLLEKEVQEHPDDQNAELLLAQAYLGLAHFEMFDFIQQIMSAQNPSEYVELSVAPSCNTDKIANVKGYDIRCLFYRILEHLPNVEDPNFVEARDLLRTKFPDPSHTPEEVNFLAAFVEASSALYRVRMIAQKDHEKYLQLDPDGRITEDQFHFIIHNFKAFLSESSKALTRLRYSYGKLRKLVVDMDGKPLIKVGAEQLDFSDSIDGPQILRFLARVVHDHADSINNEGNSATNSALWDSGYYLNHIVNELDQSLGGQGVYALGVTWRFDQALTLLLDNAADALKKTDTLSPVDFLWKHPPGIFAGLNTAMMQAWDQETRQPLLDYFADTRAQWYDLRGIIQGWDSWIKNGLTEEQRVALREHFKYVRYQDPRLVPPPSQVSEARIIAWEKGIAGALQDQAKALVTGQLGDVPALTPEQARSGQDLLNRTIEWNDRNLWH